ncbi:hypothetical protein [Microbacterium yannicii]|uniref:hypothetical protein n=1 Tax=Microbacterium yannicii TaxID=671622 RepID=UPI0003161632|nr:hypothetical protein [Microbacterium yannicii]
MGALCGAGDVRGAGQVLNAGDGSDAVADGRCLTSVFGVVEWLVGVGGVCASGEGAEATSGPRGFWVCGPLETAISRSMSSSDTRIGSFVASGEVSAATSWSGTLGAAAGGWGRSTEETTSRSAGSSPMPHCFADSCFVVAGGRFGRFFAPLEVVETEAGPEVDSLGVAASSPTPGFFAEPGAFAGAARPSDFDGLGVMNGLRSASGIGLQSFGRIRGAR